MKTTVQKKGELASGWNRYLERFCRAFTVPSALSSVIAPRSSVLIGIRSDERCPSCVTLYGR
jgi:hypothetical protein